MKFPGYRPRRLRKSENIRKLLRETALALSDIVMPFFVIEGKAKKEPIQSMPGIFRYSIDELLREAETLCKSGIKSILLFGVPGKSPGEKKLYKGQVLGGLFNENGVAQRAIRKIKKELPEIVLMTDVCMCSYTVHGHCGILKNENSPTRSGVCGIDNDKTLEVLKKAALAQAEAGADMVAPSAMMDGQVGAIREVLDKNGFKDTAIMSYAAKYASNFYGPFREAAASSPEFGDRKSHQMDYHNSQEALREVEADIEEGADIVMIKPALAYLDVIRAVKDKFNIPLAAYNVSGEYSMVKAASQKGWLDEQETALEILTSIKRAGADIIITYWAKEAAKWLKG